MPMTCDKAHFSFEPAYSTKRHCFKRTIFLCKVFTTLKLRKFNILNFFFFLSKKKRKKFKNEFGPVDLFVNEP